MSKYRKTESAPSKAKLYWAIGIVAAIVVVILLVWNSGIFSKNATAATVGDETYSTAEVAYYYQNVANSAIKQFQAYESYGLSSGYDTSRSPSEQYFDEENGVTYADYFMDSALEQLQQVTILCNEAKAAGYTLSEDGQNAIQQNLSALQMYSVQQHMSEKSYLKALYGRFMTMGLFKDIITDSILASEYSQAKANEFTYSDTDLSDYYNENASSLDSYDYRFCYINSEQETKTDADGNPVEATEEETAAAMEEASQNAESMIASVRGGTAFNTAAQDYVSESSASSFEDPEYNHQTDVSGSSISSVLGADVAEWLMDDARTPGELTAIEMEGTGYCVVQFLGRDKGEDTYQTMDYRFIQIAAETTENEDGVAVASDEQLAAAKEQAEALLAEFTSGDGSAASFDALVSASGDAETISESTVVEGGNRDSMSADMVEWLFAADRKAGDAEIIAYTDSNGNETGYQLVLVDDFGDVRWEYQAANALRSADYEAWFTALQEDYPAVLTDAAKKIPNL